MESSRPSQWLRVACKDVWLWRVHRTGRYHLPDEVLPLSLGREKFLTRTFVLGSIHPLQAAISLLPNLPIDSENPLEVVVREKQKVRGMDANARMWAGPLKDIEEQAWVGGRRYGAEVWHEQFKREYLPEDDDPELSDLAKEGYRKWAFTPSGERVLVGSTTDLLKRGFALYMTRVEAFGASLGVRFSASPRGYGQ